MDFEKGSRSDEVLVMDDSWPEDATATYDVTRTQGAIELRWLSGYADAPRTIGELEMPARFVADLHADLDDLRDDAEMYARADASDDFDV